MRYTLALVAGALVALVAAFAVNTSPAQAEEKGTKGVDPKLEEYKPVAGVAGTISSVGSDTLNNLMTLWGEGFKRQYPNFDIKVDGKGSATAPPALIDGTADIGPMSRAMKQSEIDAFEKKYGWKPSVVGVAIDALAVFVHKDNPVEKLSMQEVDAIFSQTRKGGHNEDVTKWGQVGLTGDWQNANVVAYGRNSASGTYGYFKEVALFKGDFKNGVKEQPGSAAVVQSISVDRNAIGYSGIGYKTAGVRTVPLSNKAGEEAYDATDDNCYSGKYPLSRYLYIYFNRAPGKELSPVIREFFTYVLSKQGQEVVVKDGYIPLNKTMADRQSRSFK